MPDIIHKKLKIESKEATRVIRALTGAGGDAYIVGGWVRDAVLGRASKDIDIEVHGLNPDRIGATLKPYGAVQAVGAAFGVLKIRLRDGQELDVTVPRRESVIAGQEGARRGFLVEYDPTMTVAEAAARRDYTINAMMYHPLSGTIYDPYGGYEDIKTKTLRHTTKHFAEDALRVLRGMQFAARWGFTMTPATAELCRQLQPYYQQLPVDRVRDEWLKMLRGDYPDRGIEILEQTGWLELYPALSAMALTPQDANWHPEGWSHRFVSFDSFSASVAQTNTTERQPLARFRKLVTSTIATNTRIVEFSGTESTNSVVTALSDGFTPAVNTRFFSKDESAAFDVAIHTQPESFVFTSGATTASADEVVRVMFEVPLSCVSSVMKATVNDYDVFQRIVRPVVVYMMDMFEPFKAATEIEFHNDAVDSFSPDNARPACIHVPVIIADARPAAIDGHKFVRIAFDIVFKGNSIHGSEYTLDKGIMQVKQGDVLTHAKQAMREAVRIAKRDALSDDERIVLVLSALLHDIGKPVTTSMDERGHIISPGHAAAGVPIAVEFLSSIGIPGAIGAEVLPMVAEHMCHVGISTPNRRNVNRLVSRLGRASLPMLVRLCEADASGRHPAPPADPMRAWLDIPVTVAPAGGGIAPLIQGRDLVARGWRPGPDFKPVLSAAYEAQLNDEFSDAAAAQAWLDAYLVRI
jgi:hypothetical protein